MHTDAGSCVRKKDALQFPIKRLWFQRVPFLKDMIFWIMNSWIAESAESFCCMLHLYWWYSLDLKIVTRYVWTFLQEAKSAIILMQKNTKLRDSLMFTRTIITALTIGNLCLTWLGSQKCELLHNYGGVISTDAKNASTTFDLHTFWVK